jgi:hypothetical protein
MKAVYNNTLVIMDGHLYDNDDDIVIRTAKVAGTCSFDGNEGNCIINTYTETNQQIRHSPKAFLYSLQAIIDKPS